MCGIFGLIQSKPLNGDELCGMSHYLKHRGPDDEGFLVADERGLEIFGGADTPAMVYEHESRYAPRRKLDGSWQSGGGGVALGHRRLSIVDLSPQGHQPMSYRDRYWIIFNGEVYNYLELRQELTSLGHRFVSLSDTEVILAAYAEWGPACLSRFNGMWGLAILDRQQQTLFIARDRFGVKPVYYWSDKSRLAFASEIKAFTALSDWRAQANRPRLMDFLVWNTSDHTMETMFSGVRQVPAGHYLLLDVGAAVCGRAGAWDSILPVRWYALPEKAGLPPGDAVEELRATLEDAVRLRLRSDVTVGSCLSGGLDSSAIVCLMSDLLAKSGTVGRLKTFTAASHDAKYDETAYARTVIDTAKTDACFITPNPTDFFQDFERIVWHQDEPFPTASIFAQWRVFQAARKNGVIVMLDGQGADETLCGYPGFFGAYLAGLIRQLKWLRWVKEIAAIKREVGFSPLRSIGYTAAYACPELLGLIGRFDRRSFSDSSWLRAGSLWALKSDPVRLAGGRSNSVRAMSVAQVTATNLPMLLHWEDRNSMASSVEARVPFLDYRVVELCLRIPDAAKLEYGVTKSVLRRAMAGRVPDQVLNRRDKMGFVTAEPLWMKRDLTERFREELKLAIEILGEIVDPRLLIQFEEVINGDRPFDHRYFRVMCAGNWVRRFNVKL